MKFNLNHLQAESFQFLYKDRHIKEAINIKFLGLKIDKHMNWKTHIMHIMPKLSNACYTTTCTYHFSAMDTVTIYYAYFHSIMKYGIAIWGNSVVIKRVFQL
jgi:hypothetical protein